MKFIRFIVVILLTVSFAIAKPLPPATTQKIEITDLQKRSVNKAIEWLIDHQLDDGGWGGLAYSSDSNKSHIGISSLCGLALMQAGNLPGRGKYGSNVNRCLAFVLSNCQESGLISGGESQPMYSHCFAVMFLSEVYGMTDGDNGEMKEKLEKAVHLIERVQNTEGGFRYQPVPYDADISVTVAAIMALRDAQNCGIQVDKAVIDKAVKYVLECQGDDGGFCYQRGLLGAGSGFTRTAAGLTTLFHSGISESKEIDKGVAYILKGMNDSATSTEGCELLPLNLQKSTVSYKKFR